MKVLSLGSRAQHFRLDHCVRTETLKSAIRAASKVCLNIPYIVIEVSLHCNCFCQTLQLLLSNGIGSHILIADACLNLQEELKGVLKDYVGRESPLYFAERLTERYKREDGTGPNIYLKREDLNHTGAHKINNAVGQALLAKRIGEACLNHEFHIMHAKGSSVWSFAILLIFEHS